MKSTLLFNYGITMIQRSGQRMFFGGLEGERGGAGRNTVINAVIYGAES